jgi:hypothetical protein
MSEENNRTVAEIQQEYAGVCTRAGHCQYQIRTLQKDLDLINETLQNLNLEAFKAKQEAEAAAPAVVAADPEATS